MEPVSPTPDNFAIARNTMVDEQLLPRKITDPRVLAAMRQIPRHLFVVPEYAEKAYDDSALPSAGGQTISQPYIVAFMSEHLEPQPHQSILEIGTGTGYQTAILAQLVKPHGQIFTIERSDILSHQAESLLHSLGITNVHYHIGDGSQGWPDAPLQSKIKNQKSKIVFDRILVTAATPQIPPPLLAQLKPNALLLAPIGPAESQTLTLLRKTPAGISESPLLPCRFVPLLGRHGFPEQPRNP